MLHSRDFLPRHRAVRSRAAPAGEADSDHGKEGSGTVVKYEILLMLDPELPEQRQEEVIARARELIERGGGRWVRHDAWGRRRLAYEIGHRREGVYHLFQFDVESETLDELSRILRITDGVMRHMATRRVEGGQTAAPPEPESVPAAAYADTNISSQQEE
jgi:small subunit ribosomal protein S6